MGLGLKITKYQKQRFHNNLISLIILLDHFLITSEKKIASNSYDKIHLKQNTLQLKYSIKLSIKKGQKSKRTLGNFFIYSQLLQLPRKAQHNIRIKVCFLFLS